MAKSSGRRSVYIPVEGDIVWASFDNPPTGREQGYHRRAIVVSPIEINKLTSKALVFPITTKVKNYKFEVPLPEGMDTTGVILSGDIKTIDWKARDTKFIEKASPDIVREVAAQFLILFPALYKLLEDT